MLNVTIENDPPDAAVGGGVITTSASFTKIEKLVSTSNSSSFALTVTL